MTLRTLRRGLILFSAVWMIFAAAVLIIAAPGPEVEAQRRHQLELSLIECQEEFPAGNERYQCTSSRLRHQSWSVALLWTQRFLFLIGPPMAAGGWFAYRKARLERLREERRRRSRLRRRD